MNCLCILGVSPLSNTCTVNIFLQFIVCFSFLNVFQREEAFNFNESNCLAFTFMVNVICKKFLPTSRLQRYHHASFF